MGVFYLQFRSRNKTSSLHDHRKQEVKLELEEARMKEISAFLCK